MKSYFGLSVFSVGIVAVLNFFSCQKTETPVPDSVVGPTPSPPPSQPPVSAPCNIRPIVNAALIPVGSLSEGRIDMIGGTVGSKIFFAGGIKKGAYSSRIDIYDTITKNWSTAELTIPERQGMVVATVGNKIFFAGGGDNDWTDVTSRIDIYDASINKWSTAELSQARKYLAAATLGNKIFFAGGGTWEHPIYTGSDVVDIYDDGTGTWSTARLSEGRFELSATTAGNKVYFAGGSLNIYSNSKTIDIYDASTNSWSTEELKENKAGHATISTDNKIFWAGGANTPYWYGSFLSGQIEIRDIATGLTSFACIIPKKFFSAVTKDNKIIFFTGGLSADTRSSSDYFDIFNTETNQWSTGVLNTSVTNATVISVNNIIYVAGGRNNSLGPYFNNVWKLEF